MKFFLSLLLLMSTNPSTLFSQEALQEFSLRSGEFNRKYLMYVPSGLSKESPADLVFVLHGGGGKAGQLAEYTGFLQQAIKYKFILVFPQGYRKSWADARGISLSSKAGVNDVQFFRDLVEVISGKYPVNAGRIFACGISNGGFMCQLLASELSDQINAVVSICASLPEKQASVPAKPVNIMLMNGTADPLVPYNGGDVMFAKRFSRGRCISTEETISKWVEWNQCEEDYQQDPFPDTQADGTTSIHRQYSNLATGIKVELIKITGGGHTWPGKSQYLPESTVGKVCTDFDGNEVIWNFFIRCADKF